MEQAKLWDKQLELLELVVKVVEEVQVAMELDKAGVLMEVIWFLKNNFLFSIRVCMNFGFVLVTKSL